MNKKKIFVELFLLIVLSGFAYGSMNLQIRVLPKSIAFLIIDSLTKKPIGNSVIIIRSDSSVIRKGFSSPAGIFNTFVPDKCGKYLIEVIDTDYKTSKKYFIDSDKYPITILLTPTKEKKVITIKEVKQYSVQY